MTVDAFITRSEPHGSGFAVAIKDVFDRVGEVTMAGSKALANSPPATKNAEIVERLEAADCRIVGRTKMHELAYGVTGINAFAGTPTNPLYPELIPGGSSSGSATAAATGDADFTIGTDTGGSIRIPAACCGVFGLKTTFGRVSRKGATPAISSLDCVGPFARDLSMIEAAMKILAPDWRGADAPVSGKVVLLKGYATPLIDMLVEEAARQCFDYSAGVLPGMADAIQAGLTIIGRETWNACGALVETGLVGEDVANRLLNASKISDADVDAAEAVRHSFTAEVDALLQGVDAIILPTLPCLPPLLSEAKDARAAIPITDTCRPFNLSGHPAISVPIGEIDGRPVAMQLVGRHGDEETLCALARKLPIFRSGDAA